MKPYYFDYMATTPIDPRVIECMLRYMGPDSLYGNSGSITHYYGQQALAAVEDARAQVAAAVNVVPESIIFTSGATEANNLAILGAARFYHRKGKHLITMSTEHKAVLDTMQQLEKEGFRVTYLQPKPDGLLDLTVLEAALTDETLLVSIMQVNNEIGVIQDIAAIGALLEKKGILFHVDAAQSLGKLAIDLQALPVHLMSFSAHKVYGPKGIGALYVKQRPRVRLLPLSFGGGQEQGLRSGTLPTHQIVGMGAAVALASTGLLKEQQAIAQWHNLLWDGIKDCPFISLNGHPTQRVLHNLNLSFAGIDSEDLLIAVKDLAVSTRSACLAASFKPSYVLKALGLSDSKAASSLRLSLGRFTTEAEIQHAITVIKDCVKLI